MRTFTSFILSELSIILLRFITFAIFNLCFVFFHPEIGKQVMSILLGLWCVLPGTLFWIIARKKENKGMEYASYVDLCIFGLVGFVLLGGFWYWIVF